MNVGYNSIGSGFTILAGDYSFACGNVLSVGNHEFIWGDTVSIGTVPAVSHGPYTVNFGASNLWLGTWSVVDNITSNTAAIGATSNAITATAFTPVPKAWGISNLIDYTIMAQTFSPTNIGTNYLAAFSPTNGGCTFRLDVVNATNTSWNTNNLLWEIGTVTNGTLIFDWSVYLQKWRVGFLYGKGF